MTLLHPRIVGALLLALAAIHAFFPRRFHWAEELPRISLLNLQMFAVHCFFLAFAVCLMGVLALFFADALLDRSRLAVHVRFTCLCYLVAVFGWALWRQWEG